MAKLVAYNQETPELFGLLTGSATINGDIVAPIRDDWDAES